MNDNNRTPYDDEIDRLIPDGLSGSVAAATVEVLYRLAEALESRYLGEILRDRQKENGYQRDLWD